MSKEEKIELTNLSATPLKFPEGWKPKDAQTAYEKAYTNDHLTESDKAQIRLFNAWKSERCKDHYMECLQAHKDGLRAKNERVKL